jgi:hypothetical protein
MAIRARTYTRVDPARRVLESSIEAYFLRQVKARRGLCPKLQRLRGWPDRIAHVHGTMFYAELKRPIGGRYQPLQRRIHAKLRAQGAVVLVLLTRAAVDDVMAGLLAAGTNPITLRHAMDVLEDKYHG